MSKAAALFSPVFHTPFATFLNVTAFPLIAAPNNKPAIANPRIYYVSLLRFTLIGYGNSNKRLVPQPASKPLVEEGITP